MGYRVFITFLWFVCAGASLMWLFLRALDDLHRPKGRPQGPYSLYGFISIAPGVLIVSLGVALIVMWAH